MSCLSAINRKVCMGVTFALQLGKDTCVRALVHASATNHLSNCALRCCLHTCFSSQGNLRNNGFKRLSEVMDAVGSKAAQSKSGRTPRLKVCFRFTSTTAAIKQPSNNHQTTTKQPSNNYQTIGKTHTLAQSVYIQKKLISFLF